MPAGVTVHGDRLIPLRVGPETESMFVLRKGVDTRGYKILSNAELMRLMDESARQLKLESLAPPCYTFHRFKPSGSPPKPHLH